MSATRGKPTRVATYLRVSKDNGSHETDYTVYDAQHERRGPQPSPRQRREVQELLRQQHLKFEFDMAGNYR